MRNIVDQIAIQQMIDNEIEESLTIEYKAAKSLGRKDSEKLEIMKDVSAMANSAGGRIYYGVAEYDEPEKKHLPEKIDPIDRTQFSREWLEQVNNTIRPKINDLIIKSVSIDMGPNHVVYVVDIPQSRTAHQAKDYRYYKRHNFMSVPMEDYEIRDVMGRNKYPNVILDFVINNENFLEISAQNYGEIYAKYVRCLINIPTILLSEYEKFLSSPQRVIINDIEYCQIYADNSRPDTFFF
jgi:predicted HTH transcriptional regulator